MEDPNLVDHPLQNGRRTTPSEANDIHDTSTQRSSSLTHRMNDVVSEYHKPEMAIKSQYIGIVASGNEKEYICKVCSYHSKFWTVLSNHVTACYGLRYGKLNEDPSTSTGNDMLWNYKNCEFFINAILGVTSVFERYGDGLGCYIINKILLPVFHGLKHSNYSNSIHRFIARVLCEATPKEGMILIHERFSNRRGKPGCNINRDLRMEYLIGTLKKLIGNQGSNFSKDQVKHINSVVDIKEELFLRMRESYGVKIRSGKRTPRSDDKDYKLLFDHLTATKAHLIIENRRFGDFDLCENLMDDPRFNKANFYRWVSSKNKEFKKIYDAKVGMSQ